MEKTAFSFLHPTIQEKLYKMRWTELRPIQEDSIRALFTTDNNLIISAKTASGKTEAAFLPILSQIVEKKGEGISAIYVGPLKALINDQFQRLEKLCELAEIPVFKWHGDVGSSGKKKFLKNPSGVLLITPESIESLFINHSNELSHLFGSLSFIVIDEMHSFIGNERGAHLKSLLSRVMHKSPTGVRLIGLSATFGDPELAKKWLLPRNPESIKVISDPTEQKDVKYQIRSYILETPTMDKPSKEKEKTSLLIDDIVRYFYGKTALIFVNSRELLEFYTDSTRAYLERKGLPDCFRIHHGSLSKSEREDTEDALKLNRPTATFCSSTLEMGIDVGNVSCIGQIGAPWSVNSLTQRLGRSGRKEGEPSILIMFIAENPSKDDSIVDRLHPELLRAVAMSELMIEKWNEPPQIGFYHFSTLIQQIMSVIAEHGGSTASDLFNTLIQNGAFQTVSQEDFLQISRSMGAADLIEQDERDVLILGLEGEKIVRNFEFYSAFTTPREFSVIHKGGKIGSIQSAPDLETRKFLILAGRRWEILEIDFKRSEILVEPSKGGKVPKYFGGGGAEIHPKIREKMREIVTSDYIPTYLNQQAQAMIREAQHAAREAGLLTNPFVVDGNFTYWFTWTGSAKHRTLFTLGKEFAGLHIEDEEIALKFKGVSPSQILEKYNTILTSCPSPEKIAEKFQGRTSEKYDQFVPENLQIAEYAKRYIDTDISLLETRCR
ncbi:DEAD/DEAH box helicase [Methanoregula sp.]|jgi:ATP-dependent Lhr-like helicase|uniref:DEAD/DEAH box helicase n=1 Tax=Methanoregula sp. TaxID=2052170 RepID=UPI0025EF8D28|nr:DEAD/DEAH box helicase [Methanoregula sp.]